MGCNCTQAYLNLVRGENEALARTRLKICFKCPMLLLPKLGGWCQQCGCWMTAKVRDPKLQCPGYVDSDGVTVEPKWLQTV